MLCNNLRPAAWFRGDLRMQCMAGPTVDPHGCYGQLSRPILMHILLYTRRGGEGGNPQDAHPHFGRPPHLRPYAHMPGQALTSRCEQQQAYAEHLTANRRARAMHMYRCNRLHHHNQNKTRRRSRQMCFISAHCRHQTSVQWLDHNDQITCVCPKPRRMVCRY